MIIRSDGLNKSFNRNHAVRGISLAVPEGSIYALIGQNGAGKTTTIKTLLNILMPTSGQAEVLGVDSKRLSPTELAQIGYVSESQELPDKLTVTRHAHEGGPGGRVMLSTQAARDGRAVQWSRSSRAG